MREDMFSDPSVNWGELEPFHVLALRACAPSNVFTSKAKARCLARLSGNPSLTEIADTVFLDDDFEFVNGLSEDWGMIKTVLIELMHLVYRSRIRPADSRVKAM